MRWMNASSLGSTVQPRVSAHQSARTCGSAQSNVTWKSYAMPPTLGPIADRYCPDGFVDPVAHDVGLGVGQRPVEVPQDDRDQQVLLVGAGTQPFERLRRQYRAGRLLADLHRFAALGDLDPAGLRLDVHLAAIQGVRVDPRFPAVFPAG